MRKISKNNVYACTTIKSLKIMNPFFHLFISFFFFIEQRDFFNFCNRR